MAERLKRRALEEQQQHQRRASFGEEEGKGNSPVRRESMNSSPASSVNSRRGSINSGCYSTGAMTTASTLNATPLHTFEASGGNLNPNPNTL